jgi:hypothetical protein
MQGDEKINQTTANTQPQPSKPPKPHGVVEKISGMITAIDKKLLKIKFMNSVPIIARRLLIIFGLFYLVVVILFLLAALIIAIVGSGSNGSGPAVSPPPKVTPAPEENRNPSVYATDSAVLQLQQDVDRHDENLRNTEVTEPILNVPSLNFDVSF